MATATMVKHEVPESKYALVRPNGALGFCEVQYGKPNTKWDGFMFVSILVGAPGDWRKIPAKGEQKQQILSLLAQDGYQTAAVRFSTEYTVCACCGSPLSDPFSIANGLGPKCIKRFA